MKVIGLGLPRTGTRSLAKALELLFQSNKTLHGVTLAQTITKNDMDHFTNFLKGNFDDYFTYMNTFDFILDIPSILFLDKSAEVFKNTKFIMTCRNPKEFAKSWSDYMTLSYSIIENNKCRDILTSKNPLFIDSINLFYKCRSHKFHFSNYSLEEAIIDTHIGEQLYTDYLNYVQEKFKGKDVLYYTITDGWTPLCNFLNLDIPKENFPHVNKLDEHEKNVALFHNSII
jgi:hypothetical protein